MYAADLRGTLHAFRYELASPTDADGAPQHRDAAAYAGFAPVWTFRTTPRAAPQSAPQPPQQEAAGYDPIFSSPTVSAATGVVFFGCVDGKL